MRFVMAGALLSMMVSMVASEAAEKKILVFDCHSAVGVLAQDLQNQLCDELAKQLALAHSEYEFVSGLDNDRAAFVRLTDASISNRRISGRLGWRSLGHDSLTIGPLVETSIRDTTVNSRAIKEFAKALVDVTVIKFE